MKMQKIIDSKFYRRYSLSVEKTMTKTRMYPLRTERAVIGCKLPRDEHQATTSESAGEKLSLHV